MMAVVAIVGLDCGLVRLFLSTGEGLGGLCGIGLSMSGALIGALLARGRLRRFCVGSLATGFVVIVGLIASAILFPRSQELYIDYLNAVLRRFPRSFAGYLLPPLPAGTPDRRVSLMALLFIEAAIGIPVVAVALAGGLVALFFRRRARLLTDPGRA